MAIHPPALVRVPKDGRALELRPPSPRDAPALIEAIKASLPELRRFMPWAHADNTVEQQYARLVGIQRDYWGAGDTVFHLWEGPRMLGCFGMHARTLNTRGRELGYWVRSDAAGQGVATTITRALVIVGVEHFGLERVQLMYNAANHGSRRVAEKCGFQLEGRMQSFETAPTEAELAAGRTEARVTVMTALLRDQARALPWYAPLRERLEIFGWRELV